MASNTNSSKLVTTLGVGAALLVVGFVSLIYALV
jgi:hypothetical protein